MLLQAVRNVLVLLILLGSFDGVFERAEALNYKDPCLAPNSKSGICIKIAECGEVLEMLKFNLTSKGKKYLAESKCGDLENESDISQRILICCISNESVKENPTDSLLPKPQVCGTQFSNRIYGGTSADPAEYPWMALIFYKKMNGGLTPNCAGALINPRYVLSAAHCLKNQVVPSVYSVDFVRLGEYNIDTAPDCFSKSNEPSDCLPLHIDFPIEEIIVHELFKTNELNQHHDIALIRLNQSVEYTHYIKPICLPLDFNLQEKEYLNVSMYIAGWGSTETNYFSSTKLKASVTVLSIAECQEKFSSYGKNINSSQLCAGGVNNMDTCRGDSGGPLMVAENNYYYVAGIVSYGPKPCGYPNWPGVYTRVGYYIPWIIENIKP